MSLTTIPIPALLALGGSAVASIFVATLVWRREDHLLLKVAVTVVTFLPLVGPIFGLWVSSFPDKMHPDLQAKYKNALNSYSVPKASIEASVKVKGKSDAA